MNYSLAPAILDHGVAIGELLILFILAISLFFIYSLVTVVPGL